VSKILTTIFILIFIKIGYTQSESDYTGEWFQSFLNVTVEFHQDGTFYWQYKNGSWRIKDDKLEAVLSDRRLIFSLSTDLSNLIFEKEYWGTMLVDQPNIKFEKFRDYEKPKQEEKPIKKKKKKQH